MTEVLTLLDSPRRHSLESQSAAIRIALKDFERQFACNHNGQKPSKADIKADQEIAGQYKAYNKIRDVLRGTISYNDLAAPAKINVRRNRLSADISGSTSTPQKRSLHGTPRRTAHAILLDAYDAPKSASPIPIFLTAIGPTPQRDGKIVGLFDTLTRSPRSSVQPTPASRKRKAFEMFDDGSQTVTDPHTAQTPSHRKIRGERDLLDHLTGTPIMTPHTGRRNQIRTPISDGRKFMLSQFFATPSVARCAGTDKNNEQSYQTPLRDRVLGLSPCGKADTAPDATPSYLKRSTSFKDRLMSVSTSSFGTESKTSLPASTSGGPPTLRHLKSAPKPLSQIVANLRNLEDGDFDDDLEAMYEIEDLQNAALVINNEDSVENTSVIDDNHGSTTVWKKKGQKRTTKRTKIRPSAAPISEAPKFVTAEDDDDNNDDTDGNNQEDLDFDAEICSETKTDIHPSKTSRTDTISSRQAREKPTKKKAGTINPNAQSHMNFRSLKIRNKNSKAKGTGRGKFSRRR